jgi:hypothetical protein
LQHHSPSNQIPETFIAIKNPKKERKKNYRKDERERSKSQGGKKNKKKTFQ